MAWSDQCKISFAVTVRAKQYQGEKKRSTNAIIKEISGESGIPASTLQNWWADAERGRKLSKTGQHDPTHQEQSESGTPCALDHVDQPPIPLCKNGCGKTVYLQHGKPLGPRSRQYGLCPACYIRSRRSIAKNKDADPTTGLRVVCPNCGHEHYVHPPTGR